MTFIILRIKTSTPHWINSVINMHKSAHKILNQFYLRLSNKPVKKQRHADRHPKTSDR